MTANKRASPTANWPAAADAGGWPVGGGLRLTLGSQKTEQIMAIFGIGAYYDADVSGDFINNGIAGPGWSKTDAPELHQFVGSLKVGDIVYIKSASPRSKQISVKAIGVIADDTLITNSPYVSAGRNVMWLVTTEFGIPKPREKNNVRLNTMYEEFHPDVQKEILNKLFPPRT